MVNSGGTVLELSLQAEMFFPFIIKCMINTFEFAFRILGLFRLKTCIPRAVPLCWMSNDS